MEGLSSTLPSSVFIEIGIGGDNPGGVYSFAVAGYRFYFFNSKYAPHGENLQR
jgi:hypothetical protein